VRFFAVLLPVLILLTPPAMAQDGAQPFTPCRARHSLDPAERNLPGPNLSGVVGRTIGGDAAFDYSPVLRKAREDGLRWTQSAWTPSSPIPPRCSRDCGCRCAGSMIPPNGRRCCGFSKTPPRANS
jgi:hypothetical protein